MKIQYFSMYIIVTILLCILKVTEILTISWWWCFCPIWMPFAILFAILEVLMLVSLVDEHYHLVYDPLTIEL